MSKPGKKRTKYQIQNDRAEIARLYLAGKTQQVIADLINASAREYKLTQQMISYDLLRIQDAWRKSALVDIDEVKARELAKIDAHELVCQDAWQRSMADAETLVRKQSGVVAQTKDERPGKFTATQPAEITKTARGQVGDPRFLKGIEWCIEQRCKIHGVYATAKVEITDWRKEASQKGVNASTIFNDIVAGYVAALTESD